jgi:hypothetical protein
MSAFVGFTSGQTVLVPDDPYNRTRPKWYPDPEPSKINGTYLTPWWPGGAGIDTDTGAVHGDMIAAVWYLQPEDISGQSSRLGLTGTTRDVYGSPLGGVTIKVFRTADDTLQGSTVSDVNDGTYLVTTPFSDGHYIVARKSGSPDVFGATDDDLLGA